MDKCDISFIIPVYNAEKYIEKCVNSILKQKMNRYEIILINDGSTDRSLKICQEIQGKYKNIVLIDQENKGQGAARNVGIEAANGTWICFIDNDDWLEPTFFDECSKYLQSNIDIIFFAKRDIYLHSQKDYLLNLDQSTYVIDSLEEKEILQLFTLNFYYDYPIAFGKLPVGTPWGKLIRTSLFRENNCYFVESYGEDRPCMIKIYRYADKILIINKVLYNYYVHESAMRKYLPDSVEQYRRSLEEMNQYVGALLEKRLDFKEQLYHFNIAWFSYCIVQEFCHRRNPKKYKERKKDFLMALENKYYKTAFKKADLQCLPFRRRLLAFLTKYRLFRVIDLMNDINDCYIFVGRGIRKE